MAVPQTRTVTDAVIAALANAGLLVGDAEAPTALSGDRTGWKGAPGQSSFRQYVVVYPLPGGTVDGPMDDSWADGSYVYQLSCVGGDRSQAEWVADKSRVAMKALIGATVSGRKVAHVILDQLGGAVPERDSAPTIWYTPDRYRVIVTPV